MSLTQDEILEILRVVEKSEFDEFHLDMPDLKISVGKKGLCLSPQPLNQPNPAASQEALAPQQPGMDSPSPAEAQDKQSQAVLAESAGEEGRYAIKAPVLGIFYRSPKPGTPPFVEVGQVVKEDDIVCIIEVMKLFNSVKAGMNGRVVEICAENTEMVEFDQTLFVLEPLEPDQGTSVA